MLSSLVFERGGQEKEEEKLRGRNAHREEWGAKAAQAIYHHEAQESNKPSTIDDLCGNSFRACQGDGAESSLV